MHFERTEQAVAVAVEFAKAAAEQAAQVGGLGFDAGVEQLQLAELAVAVGVNGGNQGADLGLARHALEAVLHFERTEQAVAVGIELGKAGAEAGQQGGVERGQRGGGGAGVAGQGFEQPGLLLGVALRGRQRLQAGGHAGGQQPVFGAVFGLALRGSQVGLSVTHHGVAGGQVAAGSAAQSCVEGAAQAGQRGAAALQLQAQAGDKAGDASAGVSQCGGGLCHGFAGRFGVFHGVDQAGKGAVQWVERLQLALTQGHSVALQLQQGLL